MLWEGAKSCRWPMTSARNAAELTYNLRDGKKLSARLLAALPDTVAIGDELYLAEVARLERRVTIPEFTADAERMRRFPIEGGASSALNYPRKVRVHDIGENGVGRDRLERTN